MGICRVGRGGRKYTAFDLVKRCYGIHHRYLPSVGLSDPAMYVKLYLQLPWHPTLFSSTPLNCPSPPKTSVYFITSEYSDNKLVTCWSQAAGEETLADPQGKEPSIIRWTSQHVHPHPILWASFEFSSCLKHSISSFTHCSTSSHLNIQTS